jgi:hypothetical protein
MNDFASYEDFAHLLEDDEKANREKEYTKDAVGKKRNFSNFEHAQKRFVKKQSGHGPTGE